MKTLSKKLYLVKNGVITKEVTDCPKPHLFLVKKEKLSEKKPTPLPHKKERKCFPENTELSEKNKLRLKKVYRPQKRTLFLLEEPDSEEQEAYQKFKWATYLIVLNDDQTYPRTFAFLRKALIENHLSTLSVFENEKSKEPCLNLAWEANGKVLFFLWCCAQKTPHVSFTVFRTSKNEKIETFKEVFNYPKVKMEPVQEEYENKILQFSYK